MTITNQTNPVGSSYTSKKSYIAVPREGNLFIKETTFTTLRLTKTTNNPPTYRKEIFQHSSAKDEGNVVQIGVVNDKGEIEFNSQLDPKRGFKFHNIIFRKFQRHKKNRWKTTSSASLCTARAEPRELRCRSPVRK